LLLIKTKQGFNQDCHFDSMNAGDATKVRLL
jgi:hypothetical protein